jgi:hypothetical protein
MTLKISAAVVRASLLESRSSLCKIPSTSFSPKIFFTNFSALL